MPMGFRRTSKHRHLDESSSIPQAEQGHSPLGLFLPWVQGMAPIACPWGGPIQAERSPTLCSPNWAYPEGENNPGSSSSCPLCCSLVSAPPSPHWARAGLGAARACCSQQGCPPGPVVSCICPYCVSSVLPMVLIYSHPLISILLLYFHYYFASKVHLSWSFSCFLFLRCNVASCSFNDGVVWQDGS